MNSTEHLNIRSFSRFRHHHLLYPSLSDIVMMYSNQAPLNHYPIMKDHIRNHRRILALNKATGIQGEIPGKVDDPVAESELLDQIGQIIALLESIVEED